MQHQTAPLDPVARRPAIGTKTVRGVILVVIADGVPVGVEMLIHAVLTLTGDIVNNH
ncbi:hypothetical protein D3C87_1816990 [compost metagenome]